MMNPDFSDILSELTAAGAEFMIVGAFAIAAHGNPRATGDIDIWVRPSRENAERVLAALRAFGAPLTDLSTDEDAWPRRVEANLGTLTVPVLGLADLATNKRAAGRPKDLADLAWIEEQLRRDE